MVITNIPYLLFKMGLDFGEERLGDLRIAEDTNPICETNTKNIRLYI